MNPTSADAVVEALQAFVHAVRSRQHGALRDAGAELTPLEGRALAFFGRRPGATLGDLVEHSGRDKGQLARLVSGMRERGLLEARADERDGRVSRIHLTADAQELHQAVKRQRHRLAVAALDGVDEAQRRELVTLLERMLRNVQAAG